MRNHEDLLAAGPEGAIAKARFQHLIEGVQAVEARIAIEQALSDDARASRLDPALIGRVRQAIHWRGQFINRMRNEIDGKRWHGFDDGEFWDQLLALYQVAGEIQAVAP